MAPKVREAVDTAVGPQASLPDYLTIDETSALTRTPVATLYQWRLKQYGPPARKCGRKLLYKRSEVIAWLDGQTDHRASA